MWGDVLDSKSGQGKRENVLGGEGDFHLVSYLWLTAVVPCLSRIAQALHNYRSSGKTLKQNVAFYMYTRNILDEKAIVNTFRVDSGE